MVWVSGVRSSGRLERHHGWRCRRQNFATGVGNAPRPQGPLHRPLSAGMLYQQQVGAPPGLQVSAFDKCKCGTCTNHGDREGGIEIPRRRVSAVPRDVVMVSEQRDRTTALGPKGISRIWIFCKTMLLNKRSHALIHAGHGRVALNCSRLPGRSWEIVKLSI